jgi:hypothetical protein
MVIAHHQQPLRDHRRGHGSKVVRFTKQAKKANKGGGTLVPSSLPVKGYGRVQVALAYLRRVEQETAT